MAYIGKQPVVGNFVKLDAITTSATATYNLLNGGVAYFPQTANNCIVSLNGVIQSPTSAYTISGSTIVFSDALTASDSIDFILVLGDVLSIGTPSDATVTNAKLALTAGSAGTPTISTAADTNTGIFFPAADTIAFTEGGTEAMRIDSSGNVLVAKTTSGETNTVGCEFLVNGAGVFTRDSNPSLVVNRKTNDGTLVLFRQDNIDEGNISVSGTTVSYNGFTGSHWSRFIDESKPDVLRGTVMESLDQMTDWYAVEFEVSKIENDVVKTHTEHKPYALKANEQEGDVITYAWNTEKKDEDENDIIKQVQATIVKEVDVKHMMSKISDTSEAKNVYGVFHAWDNDDLINNDFYVASVGSYVVRIKAGQTVSKGDLLQSNGDGTAKVQADDLVRASSFAKVLSNTVIDTYEDGSFIVPCSLMC